MRGQSGVDLTVLGSWSMPKEGQEGMESFLRDLSTIFPQGQWLQLSREMGKIGFRCHVLTRDQSKSPFASQVAPIVPYKRHLLLTRAHGVHFTL
nr:phosphatidylinositol N-acetylglucosaminyltransferase subunit Q [Oncorhynchus nerka]